MKKLAILACIAPLFIACNDCDRAITLGGHTCIKVPEGEQVIAASVNGSIILLTQPAADNYVPTKKTLYRLSANGTTDLQIDIIEQ